MQAPDEISSLFETLAPLASATEERIPIPQHITTSRDWSLSCLASVFTDRMVFDDNFINSMLVNWRAQPTTRITPIARHTYLVDFTSSWEMYEVLHNEPWTYRADIIALKRVHDPSQLRPEFVTHFTLCTQFHNVPPELLSTEGIYYLARRVGTPDSEVRQGYSGAVFSCGLRYHMMLLNHSKTAFRLTIQLSV